MNWSLTCAALLLVVSNVQATEEGKTSPKSETRPCVANFTVEGSFFRGKTYKTWQEFSGVDYDKAYRKVAQAVAANAWGAVNSNKDTGVITAGQAVIMGKGSVAPLNVIVQEKKGAIIRVDVNFSTAGGQSASEDTAREELCKLAEAAGE
jgi:hypothetical protein